MNRLGLIVMIILATSGLPCIAMEKPRSFKEKIIGLISPAPKPKAAAVRPMSSSDATTQWISMLDDRNNLAEEDVKKLIAHGADVNATSGMAVNNTALIVASANGKKEIVKLLLAAGADVNKSNVGGYTPLMQAAFHGYAEIVSLLLQKGANLNLQNQDGHTALMLAAERTEPKILHALISAGADLDKIDANGNTALMEAVRSNRLDNVRLLLTYYANKDLANRSNKKALDLARERSANEEIIEMLLLNKQKLK